MTDRAALVRKVCRAICQAENGPCDEPICVAENGCTFWTPHAVAAIALIRAEVLEEAAKVANATTAYDDNVQKSAGCWTTGQRIAAAIRALKDKQHD